MLTTLPPALSRAERKELAAKVLEPLSRRILEKGSDDDRLRPLEALAKIDAGQVLEELEKRHIVQTLAHTDWNKSQAATILKIERSTLDRKIKSYGLKKDD